VSIPLGEEISQATGAVRAGIVSEELYEIGYVEPMSCEGLLDDPSVSPHPLKEFSDDSNRLRRICRRNTTAFAEMTRKNPNARDYLAGAILRCSRTAAKPPTQEPHVYHPFASPPCPPLSFYLHATIVR
jgi:hypothetical protein